MTQPQWIMLDWDGTLADTASCARLALNTVLAKYNREPWNITKAKYQDKNKSLKENFPNFFERDADVAYVEYLAEYTKHSGDTVRVCDGVNEFLDLLEDKKIPYGIVSNKEQALLDMEIARLFSNRNFACVLGNGATPKNKPDAQPLLKACAIQRVDPSPEKVWLIGDTKQDWDAATRAGVTPVIITRGELWTTSESIIHFDDFFQLTTVFPNLKLL